MGNGKEVFRHEFEPLDELNALKEKAAAGCSKHESGGCDCGAKSAPQPVVAQTAPQAEQQVEQKKPQQRSEQKSGNRRNRNRRNRRRNRKPNNKK